MSLTAPQVTMKEAKIQRLSFKEWLKGTVTAFDNGRTPTDGLLGSGNAVLDQDGTIRPRPSLVRYGTQPLGTIMGEIGEFVRVSGTTITNYLITLQNVSGTTQCYYSKDGGSWTLASGKIFSNVGSARFSQADEKVLITNAADNLAYLDVPTLAVIPFVGLTTVTGVTVTQTGMTGTAFTHYYKVTANSTVGETAGSIEASAQSTTLRDDWVPGTSFITIGWSAVTNAKSYNVYYSDNSGFEVLVASGITGLSFKDDGSNALQTAVPSPLGDTTAGPICARSTVINGQVFLTGDIANPFYVRYGGVGASTLDFSPFNGGGWSELGRGTKQFPVRVMPFRTGKGDSAITVLCQGTNGFGKRYIMSPDTTTIGNTVISFFDVTEDNGQDGTNSPDGVVGYQDSLWYPSTDGFKTTGTKPQLQNVLSTDTISETIIRDIPNLSTASMGGCVGNAYQEKIKWAVPVGSSTNNQIWVLDLARGGAWMKPWNIAASWLMLYNSNDGQTHEIVLGYNNVIYELTYAQATNDDGVAFPVNATSGLLKFSPDGLDWAKVIDVTFVLLKPQGSINFTISGQTEDAAIASVGGQSYTASASVAGWGEAGWGGFPTGISTPKIFGWSNFQVVPVIFGDAQDYLTIDIDEEMAWLSWELDTNTSGISFNLADVIVRYVIIGVIDLS